MFCFSSLPDIHVTNSFLQREREEQLKRETVTEKASTKTEKIFDVASLTKTDEKAVDYTSLKEKPKLEEAADKSIKDDKVTSTTEYRFGDSGENITITTVTEYIDGLSGEGIVRTTVTETIKYPSGRETVSTKVSENVRVHRQQVIRSAADSTKRLDEKVLSAKTNETDIINDSSSHDSTKAKISQKDKFTTSKTDTKIGEQDENITITTVTETYKNQIGEVVTRVTVTETTTFPSGEVKTSTKVSESTKSVSLVKDKITQDEAQRYKFSPEISLPQDHKPSITVETNVGPSGEEIVIETETLTYKLPTDEEVIKTTVTETTTYPSGKKTVSKRTSERIVSFKEESYTTLPSEIGDTILEDTIHSMLNKSGDISDEKDIASSAETKTQVGPNGEEIITTTLTETSKTLGGDTKVRVTVTENTKYPSGEETISTKVSESMKSSQSHISSVKDSKTITIDKKNIDSDTKKVIKKDKEVIMGIDTTHKQVMHELLAHAAESQDKFKKHDAKDILSDDKKNMKVQASAPEHDVEKEKVITITEAIDKSCDVKISTSKDLSLKETQQITKEQVEPVIEDILQKSTTVAAARSPILEKDIKIISKEILETEKRSYDAKVPQKEERRHSCISPAISLERIAEAETEEDIKIETEIKVTPRTDETKIELKKSDSTMKQMADNIEIIIKQASEDLDISEELLVEKEDQKDLQGEVSVDSIIEEAVHTVEGYLDKTTDIKSDITDTKPEVIMSEDTKVTKERPGLIKSLSRDSGEIVIMPKKKQVRTFSVQSSPDEVEEQIYTDSESGKELNLQ